MLSHIPRGGSQDYLEVPFSTHELEKVLSGDMQHFLKWLDAVQARKEEIRSAQVGDAARYRLGQFTTNRSRIGILAKGIIPGVRKVATDYAANAYQTVVTEPTLRVFEEEAKRLAAPAALAAPEPAYEEADITERTWPLVSETKNVTYADTIPDKTPTSKATKGKKRND